jgi:hypothetical protein
MVPRGGQDGCEKFAPIGIRSPDRPVCSESILRNHRTSMDVLAFACMFVASSVWKPRMTPFCSSGVTVCMTFCMSAVRVSHFQSPSVCVSHVSFSVTITFLFCFVLTAMSLCSRVTSAPVLQVCKGTSKTGR